MIGIQISDVVHESKRLEKRSSMVSNETGFQVTKPKRLALHFKSETLWVLFFRRFGQVLAKAQYCWTLGHMFKPINKYADECSYQPVNLNQTISFHPRSTVNRKSAFFSFCCRAISNINTNVKQVGGE